MSIDEIELRDVFTKEDPFALNVKMNDVQVEKQKVLQAVMGAGSIIAVNRRKIHAYLRSNYRQALEENKKNAGMETYELWASAQSDDLKQCYEAYIQAKEDYNYLTGVMRSYEADMSCLQSRANIFREVQ